MGWTRRRPPSFLRMDYSARQRENVKDIEVALPGWNGEGVANAPGSIGTTKEPVINDHEPG